MPSIYDGAKIRTRKNSVFGHFSRSAFLRRHLTALIILRFLPKKGQGPKYESGCLGLIGNARKSQEICNRHVLKMPTCKIERFAIKVNNFNRKLFVAKLSNSNVYGTQDTSLSLLV